MAVVFPNLFSHQFSVYSVKSGIIEIFDLSEGWAPHTESHAHRIVRSGSSSRARRNKRLLRDRWVHNLWIIAYFLFVLLLLLLVSFLLLLSSLLTFGGLDFGPSRLLLVLLLLFLVGLSLLLSLDALFSCDSFPHSDNILLSFLSLLFCSFLLLDVFVFLFRGLGGCLLLSLSYGLLLRGHTLITCLRLGICRFGRGFSLCFLRWTETILDGIRALHDGALSIVKHRFALVPQA